MRLRFDKDIKNEKYVDETLTEFCRKFTNESIRNESTKENIAYLECEYIIILKNEDDSRKLISKLEEGGITVKKVSKQNNEFTSNDQ